MRTNTLLLVCACALLAIAQPPRSRASGPPTVSDLLARLDRDAHDYHARQELVARFLETGDQSLAYYHAAWLWWMGPRQEGEAARAHLRDRRLRARAAGSDGAVGIVADAIAARQRLTDTCLNGALANRASALRSDVSGALAAAERKARHLARGDPVVRAALADLCLTVDDALCFEAGTGSRPERLKVLRKASGLAGAAVSRLPDSPGMHRLLGTIQARRAELAGRPELWGLAIEHCETAYRLDPKDAWLPGTLWALTLRAGRWEDARRWQTRAEMTGEDTCAGDDTYPDAVGGEQAPTEE